ncbi:LIC12162 family protein [Synechococcus sp. UW105]|uniref:LIC12162 family transferase n=1 Tax=Synechococcus sp. UW105 TaxID=337067 RepID=UPI000E0E1522|nr:LIC12162 family protein [Synechococcus sp. UW105]
MAKRVLITTPIEATWPHDAQPVLFLGEWCCLFPRKHIWSSLDSLTVKYHWNDRTKLYRDYCSLSLLHEHLLDTLTHQLNLIHNKSYDKRYWRILLAPWLGTFTQILFDRWYMLKYAINLYDISYVSIINRNIYDLVPRDMLTFNEMITNDPWNEMIFGQILNFLEFHAIERVSLVEAGAETKLFNVLPRISILFRRLIYSISSILYKFPLKNQKHFFISTYFSSALNSALLTLLRQTPIHNFSPHISHSSLNINARCFQLNLQNCSIPSISDEFIKLLSIFIPRHLPTIYLEGYLDLIDLILKSPWPNNPRTIFDSNSNHSQDFFKAWVAETISNSTTTFFVGQHGGNYGISLWNFTEDHQISISDYFLSWGWADRKKPKVIPGGNLKLYGKKYRYNSDGFALLVQCALPRYSYYMYSVPVSACQWNSYFRDQCAFVNELPSHLQAILKVRLCPTDYNNHQSERWSHLFPNIDIDLGTKPIYSLYPSTKLFISTYNATTFLESLYLNIPTLIFWDPIYWEVRKSAKYHLTSLSDVGILHDNPVSAARMMIDNWSYLSDWWFSSDVQAARSSFIQTYSNPSPNLPSTLYSYLTKPIFSESVL